MTGFRVPPQLFPPATFTDEWGNVFVIPEGYTPDGSGQCRSCGARIVWTITKAGRRAPLDPSGLSHFSTCPQSQAWRKRA